MVDEARVPALLRSVEADLAFLAREAGADAARPADELWLRGVKYTFVTAIEGCIDVAQHLAAARLADHDDLRAFTAAVLRWLDT